MNPIYDELMRVRKLKNKIAWLAWQEARKTSNGKLGEEGGERNECSVDEERKESRIDFIIRDARERESRHCLIS